MEETPKLFKSKSLVLNHKLKNHKFNPLKEGHSKIPRKQAVVLLKPSTLPQSLNWNMECQSFTVLLYDPWKNTKYSHLFGLTLP